ncbi:alpha-1,4 glucan phosphorylase L-2 isozyme chloroplastic/amyloplastic-like [Trifolium pratense]|uniref:Alpha-1,4 glucan phosphorylase L-2 isozyme chloroplastic/amyloplastic-like n=1 Tax=Trifolium pratense TaxID=57577 RepID=A0A2K3MXN5_TRIPR|nr:alpha-1,4 glucan phosphorylase L-2 isozyme chloroplastic/amyloplastic-like [Trifolium pratense]
MSAIIPFSTICRNSNSPLHPHSKSSFTGFSQRSNIWQLFVITKSNSRGAIRKLSVKNVAGDKKEELKEPLTEQGCLLAFSLVL